MTSNENNTTQITIPAHLSENTKTSAARYAGMSFAKLFNAIGVSLRPLNCFGVESPQIHESIDEIQTMAAAQDVINVGSFVSFSPAGRRRGPSEAWEDEGKQVIHLQELFPLTFPSVFAALRRMGPFLSPKGRGKISH